MEEFLSLQQIGIICKSRSQWSSLPSKGKGAWRLFRDYRRLNLATIPDRYPVPNIQEFTAHGTSIYSKIDLIRANEQMSIFPSALKRATPFSLWELLRTLLNFAIQASHSNGWWTTWFIEYSLILTKSWLPVEHPGSISMTFARFYSGYDTTVW